MKFSPGMFRNIGRPGAVGDEHRVEFLGDLVHGEGSADDHVALDLHPQGLEVLHLPVDDGLGQAELGDAVAQHPAGVVQGLEHVHLVPHARQFAGGGEAAGARAHHGHLETGLLGGRRFRGRLPAAQSATNRSSQPMATGSPFLPRTQTPSHWVSWGQTRPVVAGRALSTRRIWAAAVKSPSATALRNSGMRTPTGQPSTQGLFLHSRQRLASRMASSGVSPWFTSRKLQARSGRHPVRACAPGRWPCAL